jgi:MinD superfamily P-loop ATPase
MILAVASGKGGTGKTTVSVNLARVLGAKVQLLDCDVEEPNAHLFLQAEPNAQTLVTIPVPQADEGLCDGCGECAKCHRSPPGTSFRTKKRPETQPWKPRRI